MKRILLYLLFLLSCSLLHAQTVTNVDARQDGQNIVITFNMDKPCTPAIMYSTNGRIGPYNIIPEQFLQKTSVQGKSYEYKWNVLEQFEEFSFENVVFKIETSFFSVSPTQKVQFSQGNLQYQASTGTWRFAEHQYDMIGSDNSNISSSYSGWIDLFGWGTSGYNGKNPYMTSTDSIANGVGSNDIAGTNYDWGVYNKISNGGNQAGQWRTLTKSEWDYVISNRTFARYLRGTATVNGVHGLILLPDNWTLPTGVTFTSGERDWSQNTYSASEWSRMEANGAVFLPAAGYRFGTDMDGIGSFSGGYYWSSSTVGTGTAGLLYFYIYHVGTGYVPSYYRSFGRSVRLVRGL